MGRHKSSQFDDFEIFSHPGSNVHTNGQKDSDVAEPGLCIFHMAQQPQVFC